MKIAMINASPRLLIRRNDTCTANTVLQDCRRLLRRSHLHDFEDFHLKTAYLSDKDKKALFDCDIWLLSFPVYMMGLPSHLMAVMQTLEQEAAERGPREIRVYALANTDLYEGNNAYPAFRMLSLWCEACRFSWCGGMGIGGGFLHRSPAVSQIALFRKHTYHRRLSVFAEAVGSGSPILNTNSTPDMSRKSYVLKHNQYYRSEARKQGLAALDITSQPL